MANIIMLGPPGCGKGTQAERLFHKYGWPQISTGNILRHAIEEGTELGKKAKMVMDAGDMVSDEIVDGIVAERLSHIDCIEGFILDGFPRDLEQAHSLENITSIDFVFDIQVPEELIIERLGQRRVCDCGETYHLIFNPPKSEGICDECGEELYLRDDDHEQTIRHRLKIYHDATEPLIRFYKEKGILIVMDGTLSIDAVFSRICEKLEG